MRTRALSLLVLGAILAIPAIVHAQASSDTPPPKAATPQQLFTGVLLADAKLTKTVRTLLTTQAGYVDPAPVFADLTGDGKPDAVVSVDGGGTAGTIAVYVLSADGVKSGKLKVVYHNQSLYRATTAVSDTVLTVSNPHWAAGDDLWGPHKIVQRTYQWKSAAHTLERTGTTTIDGPKTVTTVVGPGTTTPTTSTTPAPASTG